ncbi:O-methyltransferase [Colletotrichum karsti]|uniref:O-methyltransferase n=1 Tax=Colletotrichum karsti TaxID=1095194 RepID=A0A9P6HZP8_9PEZI|nr:O-methyltransferase [Colletotrichum karsti]KAF9873414.1 O-methyltransferase [Colletotrichum karsti]
MAEADSIIASLNDIDTSLFENGTDRIRVRDALYNALRRLQTPYDIAWDHVITRSAGNAAVKTLIDLGVFTKWAEAGGKPITCAELAKLTGADETLLRRMMRCIAGQYLIIETDLDTYARTPWAEAIATDQGLRAWYGAFFHELVGPLLRTLPDFLRESGYRNPTDNANCNFQHWQGPDSIFFQYVGTNPKLTGDFNDAMEGNSRGNLTDWDKVYPTEKLLEGAIPGRAVVVDVGGGKGHDLKKFHLKHPEVAASDLVLQDIPSMLKGVEKDPAYTTQEYDFFTPQPVRGARAYFMHGILHDWPVDKIEEILKNITDAMEKGYSRLLIHENMINERNPVGRVTTLDVLMMAGMAAAEKTEGDWRAIVEKAGMKVVKIWRGIDMGEGIVEAELA